MSEHAVQLVFVVNGEDCSISADTRLPMRDAVLDALTATKHTSRPLEDWELRTEDGWGVDMNAPRLGVKGGDRFFLTLKIGVGASPTCTGMPTTSLVVERVLSDAPARVSKGMLCGKPAVALSPMGPRCKECGDRLVEAVMSRTGLLGVIAHESGTQPRTKEEARSRLLRPLGP